MSSVRVISDLIHRKRSPFPYEGKALMPLRVGNAPFYAGKRNVAAQPDIVSQALI